MSIFPENNMMPVEVRFVPEGNIWIGLCESLGVMTQGDTFAEAQHNLAGALLALMDVEAVRVSVGQRERKTARHKLFALVRARYGCKYSRLPQEHFRPAAHWLIDRPLDTARENGYL